MSSTAKANLALIAAVIFLLLSTSAAYFAFARLRTSQEWVQHTRDVQLGLHQVATVASRAGRIRAQYVDLGDPDLLPKLNDALGAVRNSLGAVRQLTADNPSQTKNYANLLNLTEQRLGLIDQAVNLKRSGKSTLEAQAAIARQITGIAEDIDQLLQGMFDEEQRLLVAREQRAQTSFTIVAGVLASSPFLALVLFLIHHQLLTEQVRERMRAEAGQRTLNARVLTLQDEERRKFARELHDSVGQHLAAMKMALSMLQNKLPGDPLVQDCLKMTDDSLTETRTISHLLHPPLLDEAGLNSALRWFVEGFAKRSGIEVNLDIEDFAQRFAESIELVLFRVVQESLTNVHRHSGAQRADLSLKVLDKDVVLRIKDFGRGMPSHIAADLAEDGSSFVPGAGVGLAGMTERVREIGGRLEIRSSSAGTEITAFVPVRLRPQPDQKLPLSMEEVRG